MDLGAVYTQISVLFILIITGYLLAKVKMITDEMVENFTTFILKIATPSLIIGGMIIPRTQEKLKESAIILVMSFTIYGLSLVFGKLITKVMGIKDSKKGIFEYSLMFSNVVFMGFPVIETVFGKEAIFYTAIYNIPFSILVYTVGIALVSPKESNYKLNFKAFISPGSVASIIGFIIFSFAISIPDMIKEVLNLIGSTTTPISMLVVGAMLASLPLSKMFNDWQIYIIALIRVFIIPIMIFFVFKFIIKIDNIMLIGVPVIISGMPVAANAALMAQEYGENPEIASQCIFISTLISIVSIPLLSMLFI